MGQKSAKRLFLRQNDRKRIQSVQHLASFLDLTFSKKGKWHLPGRNAGRTTAHRERYCLRYYLAVNRNNFRYPIEIRKTERPDFLIVQGDGRTIGIEHTDAGPEEYQRWLGMTGLKDGTFMVLQREHTKHYTRDRGSREAALDFQDALTNKLTIINKSGYRRADELVLVMYLVSNRPLRTRDDLNRIFKYLPPRTEVETAALKDSDDHQSFDRVLLVVGHAARFWD